MFSNYGLLGGDDEAGLFGGPRPVPPMPPIANPIPAAPPQLQIPQPQAAPMPQIVPPQRKSLMQRISENMQHTLLGPTPGGYEGLLTPQEVQSQRPGLFRTLFHSDEGSARDLYQRDLDKMVGNKVLAQNLQKQQMDLQKQRALEVNRARVQAMLGPPPEDPTQFDAWARKAYGEFLRAGDFDAVQHLNAVMQQVAARQTQKPVDDLEWVDMGGEKWLVRKSTGEVLQKSKKTPTPRDPNAPDTAAQLRDQRMFTREQQLADDFNKDTKTQRESAAKIQNALSEAPRAKAGDGAAQINLLYAFINAMDPASAVREGEIGLAQSATPVWERARALISQYTSGKSITVPPGMVDQMAGLMHRRLGSYNTYIGERSRYYKGRAQHWGLDATGLFPDLGNLQFGTEAGTGVAPTARPGDKVRNLIRKP